MTLTRHHAVQAIALATFLAVAFWGAHNFRWVEVDVDDPPDRALQLDPLLRLKHLLTRVGMIVSTPDNLDRLPPRDAELLLASGNWNLFPEREAALERWVAAGGALVVPFFRQQNPGLDWIPAAWSLQPESATAESDDAPANPRRWPLCRGLDEPAGMPPAFDIPRGFATCMGSTNEVIRAKVAPQWALDGPAGHVVLRLPHGRGSVTVIAGSPPWANGAILERDNALLALAILQARAGRAVWLLTAETRPPLLSFLWQRGAPAVLLGAAALACGLWRGARRFGPRLATPALARRSMTEQIRGTARFIAQNGSPALHAAQLRALDEAAAARLRGYGAMSTRERADALATLTGVDPTALAQAMRPVARHPALAALALLETTRRRAMAPRRAAPSPPEPT